MHMLRSVVEFKLQRHELERAPFRGTARSLRGDPELGAQDGLVILGRRYCAARNGERQA